MNHKKYYYIAIAYAYNNYLTYSQDPAILNGLYGQKKPYLAGRNNIRTYSAIPHISDPENNGMSLGSAYGDGPRITRIEGQGNGGMILDFAENYVSELINPPFYISNPTYANAKGPVDIKVYDPTLVRSLSFDVRFNGVESTDDYSIYNFNNSTLAISERPIGIVNEQVLPY